MSNPFRKLGGVLKHVAPTLGGVLASAVPGGPLVQAAVRAAGGALGLDTDSPDAVEAALAAADPDAMVRLREADRAWEIKLRELDLDRARIDARDRASARRMQTRARSRMVGALGAGAVFGFLAVTIGLIWMLLDGREVSTTANSLIFAGLGYLAAMAQQVMAFFFGSSSGSEEQAATLAEHVQRQG